MSVKIQYVTSQNLFENYEHTAYEVMNAQFSRIVYERYKRVECWVTWLVLWATNHDPNAVLRKFKILNRSPVLMHSHKMIYSQTPLYADNVRRIAHNNINRRFSASSVTQPNNYRNFVLICAASFCSSSGVLAGGWLIWICVGSDYTSLSIQFMVNHFSF